MSDLDRLRTGDETKYNSSLDILTRINRLTEYAELSSFQPGLQGLTSWRNALSAMQREVIPYCNEDERSVIKKLEVRTIPDPSMMRRHRATFDEPGLRKSLEEWEEKIREVMAHKGMGLKSGKDPGKAMIDG